MNNVLLIGRLTAAPEIRVSNGEKTTTVANFTIAINGYGEKVDFVPCVAFGKVAEVIEKYTAKGSKVAAMGSISVDKYTDKDGNKKTSVKVVVNNIEFLDSKKADDNKPEEAFTK